MITDLKKRGDMTVTDKFVLFWGSPFSQWADSPFTVDGVEYSCAEQFMMASKARFFKDDESLEKIMKTLEPSRQKALGRMVKNFDSAKWDAVSRDFVTIGNRAKFSQNPDFKAVLMATGDLEIVEASPYDRLWGIGLGESDPRAQDKSQWQGKNWLGECLMRVREEFKDEKLTFTGTLLILDGTPDSSGDIFSPDTVVDIPEHIQVTHGFERDTENWLGFAKLTREQEALKYEIHIKVEKLPEAALKMLTPAIGGFIGYREGKKIVHCTVNQVALNVERNADPRIKRLGEQE